MLPIFAGHEAGSDWNDLAQVQGRDAAHQQFTTAVAIAEREQVVQSYAATPVLGLIVTNLSRLPGHWVAIGRRRSSWGWYYSRPCKGEEAGHAEDRQSIGGTGVFVSGVLMFFVLIAYAIDFAVLLIGEAGLRNLPIDRPGRNCVLACHAESPCGRDGACILGLCRRNPSP